MSEESMSPTAALSKLQWDKKLWDRPEGKVAVIGFGILAAIALGFAGLYLLPIITTIAWNLVNAIFACAVAAVLLVSAKPMAKLFWLWNQRFWRKAHEWSVTIDPISAMNEFRDYFQRKLDVVKASIQSVRAVNVEIQQAVGRAEKEAHQAVDQAKALAKEPGQQELLLSVQRKAVRLKTRLEHLREQFQLCQRFLAFLVKYQGAVNIKYTEISEQIEEKRQEYEIASRTGDAVAAMRSVFGTGGEQQSDFDLALRAIDDSYANTIASMQMLEDEASGVMTAIQIDDITLRQNGSEKLDELEKMLDGGFMSSTPRVRVANDTTATATETGAEEDILGELFPGARAKVSK
jgi:hypothetical protein